MAGVALADLVARCVREQWRLNLALGFSQRTGWEPDVLGRLARASGATPEQVAAWLAGEAEPSTGQASQLMDALPLPVTGVAAAALNGAGK
jgi:hypothetical protein